MYLLTTTQYRSFLLLQLGLLSLGCQGKEAAPTPSPRAGEVGDITVSAVMSPSSGGTAVGGDFQLAGVVTSSLGFAAERPVTIVVIDAETGQAGLPLDIESRSASTGSYFNRTTGEFALDGEVDAMLTEGTKVFLILAADASGNTTTWSTVVIATPAVSPTKAEIISARQHYADQILPLFQEYQRFLAAVNPDPTAFPYHDLDEALLQSITSCFDRTIVQNPDGVEWEASAREMEDTAHDLLQLAEPPATLPTAELEARVAVYDQIGWWRHSLGMVGRMYERDQLVSRSWGIGDANTREGRKAFFESILTETDTVRTTDAEDHEVIHYYARIAQDTGAPLSSALADFDPGGWEPGTADLENPVWELEVTVTDLDGDGDFEEVMYDGQSDSQLHGSIEPFEGDDVSGHLLAPFGQLFRTRSFYFGGM